MTRASPTQDRDPEVFDRRQKRLLAFAWAATLLPLFAFAYLTWQSVGLNKQIVGSKMEVEKLEKTKAALNSDIEKLRQDLEAQRAATKHYRDFAGIRIRFYRESDREVVKQALDRLGFQIDSSLGTSALINREPNTIAYGSLVSQNDLRDIAVALVEAGFPLKRIAPAVKQADPKLIQIYASAESDRSCGVLNAGQIRAGSTCGDRP